MQMIHAVQLTDCKDTAVCILSSGAISFIFNFSLAFLGSSTILICGGVTNPH